MQDLGEAAFAAFVRRRSDKQLERAIGSRPGVTLIMRTMERSFRPEKAFRFAGDIQYVLTSRNGGVRFFVRVGDGRAIARRGDSPDPALTLTTSLPTFARIAAGEANPAKEMLEGNFSIDGDFDLAVRLGEMFGADALL
jgi:putative sterol carrier protein